MINKIKILVFSLLLVSCKSFKIDNNTSFVEQFFNDPAVIYNFKKNSVGNEINISDSKNLITKKTLAFNRDDVTINILTGKNDFINYTLQQYTVNEDLAFIVFWKNNENKALWFFLNKGKKTGKWYLLDVLEKTTR